MPLFLIPQVIKRISIVTILIVYTVGCHSVVSEKDLNLEDKEIVQSINVYESTLYFSSIFGSTDLDVVTDLIEESIYISLKDTLDGSIKSLLRYKNKRWAFKDPKIDEKYFYISDKSFLKYLYLDNILPNSSFITHLLFGTFPNKKETSKEGDVTIEIKGKDYFQNIYIKDGNPYLIDIFDESKQALASIEYGNRAINAPDFYLPLFLNIIYKKHNLNFSISISNFKIK